MVHMTPSFWGLVTSGLLIMVFLIYLLYIVFVKKINLAPEVILVVILLFTIAIGIHSLQHQGQEVHYKLFV